jgi:Lrp/AsnC family leucine-responsive transcriptional regulator
MKTQESQLDEFDIRLLNALQKNSRLTSIELSQVVHLSPTQCQRRLKKLEESGVISSYSAILNREKVGFEIIAIIKADKNLKYDDIMYILKVIKESGFSKVSLVTNG